MEKNILLAVFATIFGFSSCVEETARECFRTHVTKAIKLNIERAPLYSRLTERESVYFSAKMIASEIAMLPFLQVLELCAGQYWKNDIPILCQDVVSMNGVKEFSAHTPVQFFESFTEIPIEEIYTELNSKTAVENFSDAAEIARKWVLFLEKWPHSHCMTRHVLESLARVLYLTPQYEAKARARNLKSPLWISKTIIWLHLFGLHQAYTSDRAIWVYLKEPMVG